MLSAHSRESKAQLSQTKKNIKKEKIKIAVGMDSRLSGSEIKKVILNELVNLGCSVYDCGLCTTPAMFMTTVLEDYKCDGSIMITASHLPYYHNGLKFFTENGGCEKEDIKYILDSAAKQDFKYPSYKGEISKVDFIDTYSSLLVEKIRKGINSNENYEMPLLKFKIIAKTYFINMFLTNLFRPIKFISVTFSPLIRKLSI